MGKIKNLHFGQDNLRYYSDRTFVFFFSVSMLSLILCLFGRMDGVATSAIVCSCIVGWTTKRSFEVKNLPDLIKAKVSALFPATGTQKKKAA